MTDTHSPPLSQRQPVEAAVHALRAALSQAGKGDFTPKAAVILGSGLGGLADRVEHALRLPYAAIPGFPVSTVHGHAGELILGWVGHTPIAMFKGRVHTYEGQGSGAMAVPIRTLRALGADLLVVTNAAGSLRPEVGPGRLMLITDHINLLPNPLIGPNDDSIGPRFPGMADAYSPAHRATLKALAARHGIDLAEGVYLAVSGPCFETAAEIRAFRTLGADAVGMSTVPEVILARHCGLEVAAVSAITNLAEGMTDIPLSHDQTLQYAGVAARDLSTLVLGFLEGLAA